MKEGAGTVPEKRSITIPINVWYDENTKHIHLTANRNGVREDGSHWPPLHTSVRVDTPIGKQFARLLKAAGKPAGPDDLTGNGDAAS